MLALLPPLLGAAGLALLGAPPPHCTWQALSDACDAARRSSPSNCIVCAQFFSGSCPTATGTHRREPVGEGTLVDAFCSGELPPPPATESVHRVPAGDLTSWLRQHPLQPNTTLLLEAGDHTLSETLQLGPSAAGLRMSGAQGAAAGARVTGGFAVPASAWSTIDLRGARVLSARLPPGTSRHSNKKSPPLIRILCCLLFY